MRKHLVAGVVCLLLIAVSSSARAHECGNQAIDNRPNHCVTKEVHRGSTCTVGTNADGNRTCTYTHCDGVTTYVDTDPRCCCVNYKTCEMNGVKAQYVALCLGGSTANAEISEPDERAGGTDPVPTFQAGSTEPTSGGAPRKTCASCSFGDGPDAAASLTVVLGAIALVLRRRHPRR